MFWTPDQRKVLRKKKEMEESPVDPEGLGTGEESLVSTHQPSADHEEKETLAGQQEEPRAEQDEKESLDGGDNEDALTNQPAADSPRDGEVEDTIESDLTPPAMNEEDTSQQPDTTAVRRSDTARNCKWAGRRR